MIKDPFNRIKNTFLKLTSKTYQYGYEDDLVTEMVECGVFPKLDKDSQGNYFLKIGNSRTIFASHFDTACKAQVKVNHILDGNIIRTDKTSILGADDKAGVTIMLWMIKHNIPGLYYFFFGEEVGCIGSGLAAKFIEVKGLYDRIISFDRRGTTSVITHQSGTKTCSDEFGTELAKQLNKKGLNYKIDDTGVYTDSAEFTSVIPECTNLSVGYYQEHTTNENQDIDHLYKLAKACLKVDWENLPTKRDMTKIESKWDSYNVRSSNTGNYNTGINTSWNSRGYSKGNKTWNNSNFNQYDNYDDDYYKKTRRSNKKSNREFYDNGSDLVEITGNVVKGYEIEERITKNSNSKYEPIKDKFLNTSISKEEIEIIKEQYLDWNDPSDRDVYEIMINSLVY